MESAEIRAEAVRLLTADTPPRVWSLIVTIFGDMAQAGTVSLPGGVLAALGEGADIRPEAIRVALHRLKRDGWVESARAGRTVDYSLSAYGREQVHRASPRIYRAPEDGPWTMAIADPAANGAALDDLVVSEGYVLIAPGLAVGRAAGHGQCDDVIVVEPEGRAPDWVRNAVVPEDLTSAGVALTEAIVRVSDLLDGASMNPFDLAILRFTTVHAWRRLALRLPDVPPALFPARWRNARTQEHVDTLLERLPRPIPSDLRT